MTGFDEMQQDEALAAMIQSLNPVAAAEDIRLATRSMHQRAITRRLKDEGIALGFVPELIRIGVISA